MSTPATIAANYMYFPDTGPLPEAFVGEYYSVKIPIEGGMPPYHFAINTGTIPAGLQLNSDGTIFGTPQSGATTSNYVFTVRVEDNSNHLIQGPFSISLSYKVNIYVSYTLYAGETNISVDGNVIDKAKGGQTIYQTFLAGTRHRIATDTEVWHPTDNTTRFRPVQDTIWIDDASRNATFDYYTEYRIEMVTEPSNVAIYFPYEWHRMTDWYRQGRTITYTIPKIVSPYDDTEYRFVIWSLPDGDRQNDDSLIWKVSWPGKINANYDTYYRLTLFSQYGGKIEGNGWYKAGSTAPWSIYSISDVPAPGIFGWIGLKLKPIKFADTVLMDSPKNLNINWHVDFPSWVGAIVIVVVGGILVFLIWPHVKKYLNIS
jgi:hypothetical protein